MPEKALPAHLKRYVVEQDYSRYTPVDQEVWRYIMRQLKDFLSRYAHSCYAEGLLKTGIEVDRIPDIKKMSEKLQAFGWYAVPVSGFIPPAAFMELQALGFLPIASDMRTTDHLTYTPAPDIVHEAAGHAPILVDHEFAKDLKAYAQVARKAIISREDMDQYEAIRVLSDVKEDPSSTAEIITTAEKRLDFVTKNISHISEAALLGRMNWWTAEYGLIGPLDHPRIFGAGLLSSVSEAKACLDPKVKKIPLSLDCINYSYDITEPQPQLFVTPDFSRLLEVLEELANTMAFRRGGVESLEKVKRAQTVNTVELNSGLQISGKLKNYLTEGDEPAYLSFDGPTQLSEKNHQLAGHSSKYHSQGFGSPIGVIEGAGRCLSQMSDEDLSSFGIRLGHQTELKFKNGVRVSGHVVSLTRSTSGALILIAFKDCKATRGSEVLFDPSWGTYDMAVGSKVVSAYGGPADREAYGTADDFVAKVIPRKQWSPLMRHKHALYQEVRDLREGIESGRVALNSETSDRLDRVLTKLEADFPHDWLLRLDLFELSRRVPSDSWKPRLEMQLTDLSNADPMIKERINDGIRVMK